MSNVVLINKPDKPWSCTSHSMDYLALRLSIWTNTATNMETVAMIT